MDMTLKVQIGKYFEGLHTGFEKSIMITSYSNVFSFNYVNIHAVYPTMEDEINKWFPELKRLTSDLLPVLLSYAFILKGPIFLFFNFHYCSILGVVQLHGLHGPAACSVYDSVNSTSFTTHHVKHLDLLTLHCLVAKASCHHSLWTESE